MNKKAISFFTIWLLISASFTGLLVFNPNDQMKVTAVITGEAPDFTLTDIDGNDFTLSDHLGKAIIINFMATWAAPCIVQMDDLKEVYQDLGDQIVIISIDIDLSETNQMLADFKDNYGDEWIFALDTLGENVTGQYDVSIVPTNYIINITGDISFSHEGVTDYITLMSELNETGGIITRVHNINTGLDFYGIQDAIYDPRTLDGHTISLDSGTYNEHVILNKTLNLVGEDKYTTIIDGRRSGTVIKIKANWVNVSNLKIIDCGSYSINAGIWIDSHNNSIVNNIVTTDKKCGIYLNHSQNNLILNNNITDNYYGIRVEYSPNNFIIDNMMPDNDHSVKGAYSQYITILNNTITNGQHGIRLDYSPKMTLTGNVIYGQNYGVTLVGTSDVVISNNEITSGQVRGIYLSDSSNITVSQNDLSDNEDSGLTLISVRNCKADNNTFNSTGFYITGDLIENWITHDFDETNTIDSKPIYYFKNKTAGAVPPGAGQVVLVNCSQFEISNQTLERVPMGCAVVFSSDINLENNNFIFNWEYDIFILSSPRTNVVKNNISQSNWGGINADLSPNSTFNYNTITDSDYTISLYNSPFGNVSFNTLIDNTRGIHIINSSYCLIMGNNGNSRDRGVELILGSRGNLIINNNFSKSICAILINNDCHYNTVINNTAYENDLGIRVSSSHNQIIGNEISYNFDGINVYYPDNNISDNKISYSERYGIYIRNTPDVNIIRNEFIEDGVYIEGTTLSEFNTHEIPVNNTVNGKPLYYYKDTSGFNLDGLSVGQLILANCSFVNVNDLVINETDIGIEVAYVTNSNFTHLNITSNYMGFYAYSSSDNEFTDNDLRSNERYGIFLDNSDYNNITNNDISFIYGTYQSSGIYFEYSSHNNISQNNVSSNEYQGIHLSYSSHFNEIIQNDIMMNQRGINIESSNSNEISSNNISDNENYGISVWQSSNTKIMTNNITTNQMGIYVDYTTNANITENIISDNYEYGVYITGTTNTKITLNEFTNDGIFLYGGDLSHYNSHEIPTNNLVNGKPVYYYKNTANIEIHDIPVGQFLFTNCVNISISNIDIDFTDVAIEAAYSSEINIIALNISNNYHGIYFRHTSNNRITSSNIISNAMDGIYLYESDNDMISENYISSNDQYGIYLYNSHFCNITNNVFIIDGIMLIGNEASSTSHYIPLNNMVNGKPLYYVKNVNGLDFNGISAGQMIFTNCENIRVRNLQINDTDVGIEFTQTSKSLISGCTLFDNLHGIYIYDSETSNISGNTITSNDGNGIVWDRTNKMNLEGNSILHNNGFGINLLRADYNNMFNNSITDNGDTGLYFYRSSGNKIIGNNITNNSWSMYFDWESGQNRIFHNNFIDNAIQVVGGMDNNYWDDGYPSGGNYWSDFSPTCPDLYNGPITPQVSGSPDGICDDPYKIRYDHIRDNYPLKYPWGISSPDAISPEFITDLDAKDPYSYSIDLTWTAPGDDWDLGTAAGYELKYSTTGPITYSDWDQAITYSQAWTPKSAGSTESYSISGLQPLTQYWFAIRAYDEMGNYADISNSPSETTLHSDNTFPGAVIDLNLSNPTNHSLTLSWTAVADNGTDALSGNAAFYDIRYIANAQIFEDNWDSATQVFGQPLPGTPGSLETYVVTGLASGTNYFFAIKVCDEVPNWSPVSNSPNATTLGLDTLPPTINNVNAEPQSQVAGGSITISAKVTDNVDVYSVSVEIHDPYTMVIGNFTMIKSGNFYYNETINLNSLGTYNFIIWAVDSSGNLFSQAGNFEIIETPHIEIDTTPPTITNTMAGPSPQDLDGYVIILTSITDDVKVEEVWVQVIDPDGLELVNESMSNDGLIDEYLYEGTYSDIGEYNYIIWAKDTSGNWNSADGGFIIQDTTVPLANAGGLNLIIPQGMTRTFNGNLSSDNDRIENYTWSFNYDGSLITLYGIKNTFKFEKIGKYEITLTVKDPSGNFASDSMTVTVLGKDSDGDGLTDYDEDNIYGTNPNNQDTDGDDIIDSFEIVRGTDPLVPDKGKEPEESFLENILWILLMTGVVIIILLLFFLFKRNKEDTMPEKEENSKENSGENILDEQTKLYEEDEANGENKGN